MQPINRSDINYVDIMVFSLTFLCCTFIMNKIMYLFNIEHILEYNLYTCIKWDDNINQKPLKSIDSDLMESNLMDSDLMYSDLMDSDSIKKNI